MTSTDAQQNQNANESTTTAPRSRGPRITLAICLAAGIAAGIGLARPGGTANDGATTAAAAEQSQQANGAGYDAADADNAAPAGADNGAPAAAGAIDIADFAFGEPISVAAGSTITVTNRDSAPHTVTSDDGLFDTGSLGGGQATTITAPTEPGTYSFFCSIHPSMQGSFTVTQ